MFDLATWCPEVIVLENKRNRTDTAMKRDSSREPKWVLTDYCYWVTQEILHWALHTKKTPTTDLLKSMWRVKTVQNAER